jgi:hypothetical protein
MAIGTKTGGLLKSMRPDGVPMAMGDGKDSDQNRQIGPRRRLRFDEPIDGVLGHQAIVFSRDQTGDAQTAVHPQDALC